ncbi:NAD(P)/FAD-dependent oxidoreductase [Frankia sp. CNm7]|uniref:NADH:ubiquinone reductase (non-electrogenic) n=1 Tax=Frankia nepalensis TaxID=1836974 RepID=A0A937RPB5_9ACTN|nr:NAD(P)/FAD-dependent oxidoreductase [Frankia nepalensis]MBL7499927.1 NAD(P)/FAD-dependent oxidoreductase [Frankia nepalensis]MBL7511710.1 NAD(P)/FAD-dependent oxidoreductase [Frankia nepalensis]MBL7523166.1 NAD(P)/FAD-dependent oxidoreductase [Frankia nepalensis]MBL7632530.1 NAD(P)/FAD-dependent oxidoreductase [Frankia nepalensis]
MTANTTATGDTRFGPTGGGASRHRVLVIGSGFGGLFAAQALRGAHVDVTLVAKTSHHLFQPLLYQVATGILSEGEIAPSTREVLRRQANARVVLGEVTDIDLAGRTVRSELVGRATVHHYDSLIVAAGAGQSYFGNDQFAEHAPGMKSIDDALELRGRILGMFELAEAATDPADIERLLTFVVVGAGPTGVEMAGQIAELAHRTLRRDFRHIDPTKARIVLLDAAPAVLPAFGDKLGDYAVDRLRRLGVEVELGAKVTDVDATGIEVENTDGTHRRIESVCKVWAAGVQASPLGRQLALQSGAGLDRAGRVEVQPDLTLPGHPEVYVIGDMMSLGRLPGVAQVAIQGGRHAARDIRARIEGKESGKSFKYHDKGSMATISRFSAVAQIGRLRLTGFLAWLMWLAVHLVYIIGFKHRVTTLLHWAVSFVGRGRSERTVTEQQIFARTALNRLGDDFSPSLPPNPRVRPSWGGTGPGVAVVPTPARPADRREPEPATSGAV